MKTLVRPATTHDFATLLSIDQSCFPPGIAYSASELSYFMRRPGSQTLILEENDVIAAFLLVEIADRRKMATLVTLDVRAEYRRKGYATTLMSEAERILVDRGITTCILQVDTENDPALTFYRQHGFSEERRLPNYYPGGRDAWMMTTRFQTGV